MTAPELGDEKLEAQVFEGVDQLRMLAKRCEPWLEQNKELRNLDIPTVVRFFDEYRDTFGRFMADRNALNDQAAALPPIPEETEEAG